MMFNQRPKVLPTYVSGSEFADLLKATQKQHHKLAFIMAWGAGCRVSEVLNLEPRDFDFSRGIINVRLGKGKKDRYTVIPPHIEPYHMEFFPIPCNARALQKAFTFYAEQTGLKAKKPRVRFHSMRHGFATHYLECGGDINKLKLLMGHQSIAMTDIYSHLNPISAVKEYREMMGMGHAN